MCALGRRQPSGDPAGDQDTACTTKVLKGTPRIVAGRPVVQLVGQLLEQLADKLTDQLASHTKLPDLVVGHPAGRPAGQQASNVINVFEKPPPAHPPLVLHFGMRLEFGLCWQVLGCIVAQPALRSDPPW